MSFYEYRQFDYDIITLNDEAKDGWELDQIFDLNGDKVMLLYREAEEEEEEEEEEPDDVAAQTPSSVIISINGQPPTPAATPPGFLSRFIQWLSW